MSVYRDLFDQFLRNVTKETGVQLDRTCAMTAVNTVMDEYHRYKNSALYKERKQRGTRVSPFRDFFEPAIATYGPRDDAELAALKSLIGLYGNAMKQQRISVPSTIEVVTVSDTDVVYSVNGKRVTFGTEQLTGRLPWKGIKKFGTLKLAPQIYRNLHTQAIAILNERPARQTHRAA